MTLAQKFEKFSPEEQERLFAIQNAAELDTFLAETGQELSGDDKAKVLEYIGTGVAPLDDDDLEAIAGGQSKEDSEMRAKADGRIVNLPAAGGHCGNSCHHKHKWARRASIAIGSTVYDYYDVKCYKCGVWKAKHSSPFKNPSENIPYEK